MKFNLILLFCFLILKNTYGLPLSAEQDVSYSQNADEDGDYFEGDMMLNDEQLSGILYPNARNGIIGDKYRWKDNTVYIEFDEIFDIDHISQIVAALKTIQDKTCIRIRPKTDGIQDYVYITGKPTGCHSHVGRKGGKQILNLALNRIGSGCFKLGTIVHEFVHAIGLHHQQSASDRDDFVEIVEKNIKDGKLHNFKKYDSSKVTDFGVPYDYGSIMHYSAMAFSKNGEPTIVPVEKSVKIGQRERLSKSDIAKINLMYKC